LKFVVLGDLHLNASERAAFEQARADLRDHEPDALVCLGDFGCGRASGTQGAFERARDYLHSFEVPHGAILGNHDLERVEIFNSDASAVACFCRAFGSDLPYSTIELGDALGILLSSTGFRDNRGYKHEVSIDEAQFNWLRSTLEGNRNRPTIVFSHAPPLGSRLRVLQYPHLRAGNAWLNQSNDPGRFATLLRDHPQVRLWFSGHNHLGQHYEDSASLVGRCLFVHTGVIGSSSRDGAHQSRVVRWDGTLEVDAGELRVDTFDHTSRTLEEDIRFDLASNSASRASIPTHEADGDFFAAPPFAKVAKLDSLSQLGPSLFAAHRDMLLEYDTDLEDPVGVVEDWMGRTRVSTEKDEVVLRSTIGSRRITPNEDGYYFQVPARNPRILNEVREALTRRFGRRTRADS
jgi:Icc-related predicted phosphoesterase